MILSIIFIIISIISSILLAKIIFDYDIEGVIIFTFAFIPLFLFLFFALNIGIENIFSKKTEIIKYLEIASLKNYNQTDSNFFLGCGQIEEKEYYYYYLKTGKNKYIRDKILTSKTAIIENNYISPRLRWKINKSKKNWFTSGISDIQSEHDYELVVPEGTLITKFEVY